MSWVRPRKPFLPAKEADKFVKKYGFTKDKVRELHDTFCVFDKNGDGMVTTEELGTVLMKMGQRPTLRELKALIHSVDTDRSGTLDFDEFLEIFNKKCSIDPEKELYEVFQVFDKNKDGFICPNELYNVLSQLGETTTKIEAEAMIREADLNKDGKVDYKEFQAILNFR